MIYLHYRKMDKKGHREGRRVSFRASAMSEDGSARYVYPNDEYYNGPSDSYLTPTYADSLKKEAYNFPRSGNETYKVPRNEKETYKVPRSGKETYDFPRSRSEKCDIPPLSCRNWGISPDGRKEEEDSVYYYIN